MAPYFQALVYGAVQGITEFLPVSSSGHLVLLHRFWPLQGIPELPFDVALHAATLVAVVVYFRRDLWAVLSEFFTTAPWRKEQLAARPKARLGWYIILGTIPAGLAALLFGDMIDSVLRSEWVVVLMLLTVGILLIVVDRFRITRAPDSMRSSDALLIGTAQAIALVPGTSRSGITIIAGRALGFDPESAIRFTFLLSVPIIALAALKELPALLDIALTSEIMTVLFVAAASAAGAGLLAIHLLLTAAKRFGFAWFGYYRIALALFVAWLLMR